MKILLNFFAQAANPIANPFPNVQANTSTILDIINISFTIIGAIAILFLVIGGFQFVISNGDPQSAAKARSTIIYSLIGVVVTLCATAIVNFIAGKI